MSGKPFLKKVMYFLGIEDEESQDKATENIEPYAGRFEAKPAGKIINIHQTSKHKMVVFKPDSFEEVREITDEVRNRRATIVNLDKLDREKAKRILDFMSGSIYALNGSVKKIGPSIFLFVPDNIDVTGFEMEQDKNNKSPYVLK